MRQARDGILQAALTRFRSVFEVAQGDVKVGEEDECVSVEEGMKAEFRMARLLLLRFGEVETEGPALLSLE